MGEHLIVNGYIMKVLTDNVFSATLAANAVYKLMDC